MNRLPHPNLSATPLPLSCPPGQDEGPSLPAWSAAFKAGVDALALYGGARPGYR